MGSANLLIALVVLATFYEYITETIFGTWLNGKVMALVSASIGVVLCISFQLDGMSLLNDGFSAFHPIIGQIVTGIIVGGGSNRVHELFKKIKV